MSKLLTPGQCRIAIQICAMTAVAALMSGCSADTTRFGDAFGNPFATGSVQKPKKVAHASQPLGTGRTPPVTTSALAPRGQVASVAPVHAAPVGVSHETTGSIGPAHSVPGASFGGWTGQGGASVQVGAGDTGAKLAERYGVPLNVLLQVNGLHSASEVQPGGTIVVPIYNAVASAPGASRVAQAAPVRSEPVEPAEPVKPAPARAAKAEEPAEAVRKPGLPFKVAEKPQTLAERNAEAQRIVATQRAADKAVAEKAAAAQKAAEADRVAAAHEAALAQKAAEAQKAKLAKADAAHKVAGKDAAKDAAARAEAQKAAAAEKAAAAQKLAADRDAAKAKAEAVKAAAAAAKAAKVAAATPAKPAPAPAKPEQVAALEKKTVDATPTASVPVAAAAVAAPAAAPAAVTAEGGGPEFRWPARGRIIQGFKGGSGGNDGINIAVPEGTAVKAAEGGVVAYAGNELKGYGNLVLIRHPNGYVTAYANNGEIDVKRGETVKRGQTVAKSGQSGNVSSPQLHFELRKGSTPVDPTGFLAGT